MNWKNILKAPYDFPKRQKAGADRYNAERQMQEAEDRIKANAPKEDISTDVSRFASKYLDEQFVRFDRAFVDRRIDQYPDTPAETPEWKIFTGLLQKYGKDGLEEKIDKLYKTKAFITHRHVGSEWEDYVIDLETNKE